MTYDASLERHPVILRAARIIAEAESRGVKLDGIFFDYGAIRSLPDDLRRAMLSAALKTFGGLKVNGVPVKVAHVSGVDFQA